MRFPILATVIVFVIWLTYELRKAKKLEKKGTDEYWAREREANNTRKKPLDDLTYISVPMDCIPTSLLADEDEVKEAYAILTELSNKKIVNLTGISNTDLKLQYGSPNLPLLTEYDENFTLYARTMYQLAQCYYDHGYRSNAFVLLEKTIEAGTDVKANYILLAKIYKEMGQEDKIKELISKAQEINSLSKNPILRSLEELCHTAQ